MAFLDVQSSSTPQSLPLLLFSHREGGGRGAGDPGTPAAVPAPASAPRPAPLPARSEPRSPPLTLISRHITCCSCQSLGDVLLNSRGGGSGEGVGGTAVPACPLRPDFSGASAVSIPGGMEVRSTLPPPQPQVCPTPSAGAPGQGMGRAAPGTRSRRRPTLSLLPIISALAGQPPSGTTAPPPLPPLTAGDSPPPLFHHFTPCFVFFFLLLTILTEEGEKAAMPKRQERGSSEATGVAWGVEVPDLALSFWVSEVNERVSPTRAVLSPRDPRSASRWNE